MRISGSNFNLPVAPLLFENMAGSSPGKRVGIAV
jgi:hypothetical protein